MAKNPEKITTNYLVIETAMAAYAVLEDTRLLIGDRGCNSFVIDLTRDQEITKPERP